jgi:hypothetical protein
LNLFFATKDLEALRRLSNQNSKLWDEHQTIMKNILVLVLEQIKPRMIVCIGLGVFDYFCRQFELTEEKNFLEKMERVVFCLLQKKEKLLFMELFI